MPDRRRIYLDNAATSWPKPEAVYAAVDRYQRELGAPVGRGVYAEAAEVERTVARLRANLAALIQVREPRRIVFTSNCTQALNQAIWGLLRPGEHVVTTVVEHNSVLRPLRLLEDEGRIRVTRVACDAGGRVDPEDVARAIESDTRLIAVSHASNVTGVVQPVTEIGAIARQRGALLLVDAAQTAGHLPIDVNRLGADLLAASGHKGLLGPLGTGCLYVGPHVEDRLRPLMQGGTGSQSEHDRQPPHLPDKYESGNLNALGLVGWAAGVEYLLERGIDEVHRDEARLADELIAGLQLIEGLRLHGVGESHERVGVISVTHAEHDPQELAMLLDSAYGIQGRPGLHCAPLMHQALGTAAAGGTYRLSIGPFNTSDDVTAVLGAFAELAQTRMSASVREDSIQR